MSTPRGRAHAVAVASPVNSAGADVQASGGIDESRVSMPVRESVRGIGVADRHAERFQAFTQEVHTAKCAGRQDQEPYAICIDPRRGKRRSRCTEHEADPACECSSRCWCLRGHANRLKEKSYAKCTSAPVVRAIQGLMGEGRCRTLCGNGPWHPCRRARGGGVGIRRPGFEER